MKIRNNINLRLDIYIFSLYFADKKIFYYFSYSLEERQICKRSNQESKRAATFNTHTYGPLVFNFVFLFLLLVVLIFVGLILEATYMSSSPCSHNSFKGYNSASSNVKSNIFSDYVNMRRNIWSPQVFAHFVIDRWIYLYHIWNTFIDHCKFIVGFVYVI